MSMTLGDVLFSAFEIPESVTFGGSQKLIIQTLPGGGRIIDAMGRDDDDISWNGILTGVDAAARARLLDGMRCSGGAVLLIWDTFAYTVVVSNLELQFRSPWWIPYQLRCVIVTPPPALISSAVNITDQAVLSDIGTASDYVNTSALVPYVIAAQNNPSPAAGIALMTQGAILLGGLSSSSQAAGMILDDANSNLVALLASAAVQSYQQTGIGYISRAIRNQISGN